MFLKTENLWMAYPILAILLIACFVPSFNEMNRAETVREEVKYSNVPLLTKSELVRRLEAHESELKSPVGESPSDYWLLLLKNQEVVEFLNKYTRTHGMDDDLTRYQLTVGASNFLELQRNYSIKFGNDVMISARSNTPGIDKLLNVSKTVADVPSEAGALFVKGYKSSILVMLLFFAVRLRRNESSILAEFWRLPVMVFLWPLTIWKYPSHMVKREQLVLAYKVIRLGLTGALAVAPTAFVKAAERKDDDCKNTVYAGLQSQYPLMDAGIIATDDVVFQGGNTTTCDKWSVDVWNSSGINEGGAYGKRGGADEIDLTVNYSTAVSGTSLGTISLQASIGYFAVDLGSGLTSPKDDLISLQVDVARQVELSDSFSVTPFIHATRLEPINGAALSFLRPGLRFSRKLGAGWTAQAEAAIAYKPESKSNVERGQVGISRLIGNWTYGGFIKLMENNDPTYGVSFSYTY